AVKRQRRVRRRIVCTSVWWKLGKERPECTHRRPQILVGLGDAVDGAAALPLGHATEIERQRSPRGEELPQLFEVALVQLGARRKRVEQRQRERDVLADSL